MKSKLFALVAAVVAAFALSSCEPVIIVRDSYYASVYGTAYYVDRGARQASFSIDLGTSDRMTQRNLTYILDRFSSRVNPNFYEADFEIRIERNGFSSRELLYYVALQSGPDPDSYVFYQTGRDFIIPDLEYSCDAYLEVTYPSVLRPEHTSATYDQLMVIGGKLTDDEISNIIIDLNQPRYLTPGWVEGRLEIDIFATNHPAVGFPTSYYAVWWDDREGYLWDEITRSTKAAESVRSGHPRKVQHTSIVLHRVGEDATVKAKEQ